MKSPVPIVHRSIWQRLYAAAALFDATAPWEEFGDHEVIGIRDPVTDETGYGTFMGSGGELFGFVLYRGPVGFDLYRKLLERRIDQYDFKYGLDVLKFDFSSREELHTEDLRVIKSMGFARSAHGWPQFRSFLPGYFPWFLNEREAECFALALEVACAHTDNVRAGITAPSSRSGECVVYVPIDDSSADLPFTWEPWPLLAPPSPEPIVLDPKRIRALKAASFQPDSPWEAGTFYTDQTIADSKRPYFPRLAVACQQSTAHNFGFDIVTPGVLESQAIADIICASIEKSGFLPGEIFVARPDIAASLQPLAKELGFIVRSAERLGAISEMQTGMREFGERGVM